MTLEELKRLSGNGKITGETNAFDSQLATQKAQYMRENNIRLATKNGSNCGS